MRLETSVAHTVNDECFTIILLFVFLPFWGKKIFVFKNRIVVYAKCTNTLPGEYRRKAETQKN